MLIDGTCGNGIVDDSSKLRGRAVAPVRHWRCARAASVALALAVLLASSASAQQGGGFRLRASVVAGGADTVSTGNGFTLKGTAGQADAEVLAPLQGGAFRLTGGFWAAIPTAPRVDAIFFDGFE